MKQSKIFSLLTFKRLTTIIIILVCMNLILPCLAQNMNAEFYYNKAIGRGFNDLEGSIKDLTKAIELNPKYVEAYNARGTIKSFQGNCTAAIADFTESIKLNPNDAEIYRIRAACKGSLGNRTASLADYEQAKNLYLKQNNQEQYQQILKIIDILESKK